MPLHYPPAPEGRTHGAVRRLVMLLAAVAGVAVTVGLGWWQWDRAAQKLALQAALDARSGMPVVGASDIERLRPGDTSLQYRRVRLEGHWLADRTIFLDNRPLHSRTGFIVVTPLQWAGGTVLVQRGWAPRDFEDRTRLPEVPTPRSAVVVEGQIAPPPSRLFEFDAAASGPIRQNIDPESFSREIGAVLAPISIRQTGASDDGLLRDWPPPAVDVATHYGYVFQWWSMAALIAGLYVWFQLIRPRLGRDPR
ncbi:MAG TPA: SURF1 family protein [Burkholderiaceae bacterium]|nr:SURF1 family protein [Burkholderiaceae bacterium]